MFIYITYDTDGFITAYQNTEADGFTKVFILDSWITQFAQHSDKFRYDTDKKVVLNPGNLPKVSLDQLNTDFTNIKEATDQYQKNNDSSNQSVSAVLSQLAQGQSQLALQTAQALKAISLAVAAKTATSTTTQTATTTDNQEVK